MSGAMIVDSSVGVAWAVHSQASEATDELLEQVAAGNAFVVPTLWSFEIANTLLVLFRRERITAEDRDRALAGLNRLTIEVDEEGVRHAFGQISDLAAKHGLSVYDAAYLELALRRKLPLASRDQALCNAAKNYRIKLLL